MKFSEIDFPRWAAIVICTVGAALVFYVFFRFLLPVAFPFLLAWGTAFLLRPVNCFLHKKTRLPLRLVSALTVLLSVILLGWGLGYLVVRLVGEIRDFGTALANDPDAVSRYFGWLEPILRGKEELAEAATLLESLEQYLQKMLINGADGLLAGIPAWLGSAVLTLPDVLLFLFTAVVAAVYFSMDLGQVNDAVRRILPEKIASSLGDFRARLFRTGGGYLRSYLILTGVIFAILLIGFSIMQTKYALLLAVVFALLDLLPVIGVGTFLVPWSLIVMLGGNLRFGIGLLVLFAVTEIARQILEPRLVGGALGVHPILTLFSLYAGAKFLGILGMILGPMLAIFIKILFSPAKEDKKKPVG